MNLEKEKRAHEIQKKAMDKENRDRVKHRRGIEDHMDEKRLKQELADPWDQ